MLSIERTESCDVLHAPAPALPRQRAKEIAQQLFGIKGEPSSLTSERDQNFRLQCDAGDTYVLKIANSAESSSVLEFQAMALQHIARQDPVLPVPRMRLSLDGEPVCTIEHEGRKHHVRMLTFLDGRPLNNLASNIGLRKNMGALLAQLGIALRGFFHPAAGHELMWDLKQASRLRELTKYISDSVNRGLASRHLDEFQEKILPALNRLRAQVIHNDLNPDNILVDTNDETQIAGIIDFGDMVHSALINDIAVAAAYQLAVENAPFDSVCELVSAYHAVSPLFEEELVLLPKLIRTRALMTVTISAWRSRNHPDNQDYITAHDAFAWKNLHWFAQQNINQLSDRLLRVCGVGKIFKFSQSVAEQKTVAKTELINKRKRFLGASLSLTYDDPIHLVRGDGVWMYDAQGNVFLDAYNNVPHVGHCHPHVTKAIAEQSALLNTNTRYLHTTIVELAQRLSETLPGKLSVCMFVCTGSEANDMALRIARAVTGRRGAIVTEFSYHGNTIATRQLSTEDVPPAELEDWVATVPTPDTYAGQYRDDLKNTGQLYAAHVSTAIQTLNDNGQSPAACMFDSIHSSDGIFLGPNDYLPLVYKCVREQGALCIADEVQAGFGRVGSHMWGFERRGVVPDIVTLGKPMGNGHPIGAVITTPDIAAAFSRKQSYFNTYGGNPVACGAALAVLDVIESEQLQNNALQVGDYLKQRLLVLKDRYSFVGDIRGSGLFFGVEIVDDPDKRTPNALLATTIHNALRQQKILVGLTGYKQNVLKIRPPMVFSETNADTFVDTLESVLNQISTKQH